MTNKGFVRWAAFGCIKGPSGAGKSEIPVQRLQEFEDVRYPDHSKGGKAIALSLTDLAEHPFEEASDSRGPIKQLRLSLEEIDWLFRKVWEVRQLSPWMLKGLGDEEAQAFVECFYRAHNRNALYDPSFEVGYRKLRLVNLTGPLTKRGNLGELNDSHILTVYAICARRCPCPNANWRGRTGLHVHDARG